MTVITKGLSLIILISVLIISSCDLDKSTDMDIDADTWYWMIDHPGGSFAGDAIELADGTFLLSYIVVQNDSNAGALIRIDQSLRILDTLLLPRKKDELWLRGMAAASDGGLFLVYGVYSETQNGLVVKTTLEGNTIWETSIDVKMASFSIGALPDGGCYVYGDCHYLVDSHY